ncbi:MAG: hypothetical protein J2P36_35540 [Ktedonobacteraceae bacterium]|nr:hypothetical protein [Ktedonobacteraceae bacterium]
MRPTTTLPLPTPDEVPSLDLHPSLPLSVAQIRLLLRVALPQPVYAAYRSHRKRLLAQLQGLRW